MRFSATAVVGDNLAAMAKNKGVVAIVIDGMARDSDGIVGVGLPVFARGITPNSCVRSGPGRIGLPIVCAGVAIQAGDVVLGDRDGVVIIPRADVADIVAKLDDIRRAEAATQEKIRAGMTQMDSLTELLQVGPRRLRRLGGGVPARVCRPACKAVTTARARGQGVGRREWYSRHGHAHRALTPWPRSPKPPSALWRAAGLLAQPSEAVFDPRSGQAWGPSDWDLNPELQGRLRRDGAAAAGGGAGADRAARPS